MFFRKIRWRIAVLYAILIVASLLGLTIYLSNGAREANLAEQQAQLKAEAPLMAGLVAAFLAGGGQSGALGALAQQWAATLDARLTVIALDGTALAESHADPEQMESHLTRPEVQQALGSGWGSAVRRSETLGEDMIYAAAPYKPHGLTAGVVRLARPLQRIDQQVGELRRTMLLFTLGLAALAVLIATWIAERTARPVRSLTRLAGRVTQGELGVRLLRTTRDEVGALTEAFNSMTEQLEGKIGTLATERSRLTAVLEHMADGVLITDNLGQVRLVNPSAARLLGTTQSDAVDRSYVQVVRDHRLVEIWQHCSQLTEEQAVEVNRPPLFLRVSVTPLRQVDASGCLVLIQDLTQVRRLEAMRRDFVSNISHELRTPLASLKALVDTLRDGALEDPPAAERFLTRVETEVDAMTQMVQELLELSRIESGQVPLRMQPTPVSEVVLPAVDRLSSQAERAQLHLEVTCPDDLPLVLVDSERVQQVVTNLVHNAIKFTLAGGRIAVSAKSLEDVVVVSVQDTGVGISTEDLPRIFERFYKADRARRGGGTGLGLAIARHIVQGHGGRIWVDSVEGQGSTFYFSLPLVNETLTKP